MITAYAGTNPIVISKLEIGGPEDGFDLDGDGKPDNKLSAVAGLAKSAIDEAFQNQEIVIPVEFFDVPAADADTCVKFAMYLGAFAVDKDVDGKNAGVDDCNDNVMGIPGAEIPDDGIDNDCDGLADEDAQNMPSMSTADADADGQTVAMGDCDDTNAMVKKGAAEICGDGLDNDCDGIADRTKAGMNPVCGPFAADAEIPIDPLSFENGQPVIAFDAGSIKKLADGSLELEAGPSVFGLSIPVIDDVKLTLKITGATIKGKVVTEGSKFRIEGGVLGGVLDAKTADTIRGLEVDQIGLTAENSLLDATFANLLGPLLALPKAKPAVDRKYPGCRTPDIDVDRDGLEAFCETDDTRVNRVVDVCVDGDGTEVMDMGEGPATMHCTEAQKDGKDRFVDGISVALTFETSVISKIKPQ